MLLFMLFWSVGFLQAQQYYTPQIAEQEMKAHMQHNQKVLSSNAVNNTNVIYDRLEFWVDPAVRYITGKVTTTFIADSTLNFIELNLTDSLHTDSVLYHGQITSFVHNNDILRISFGQNIATSATDSVTIFYQGAPDSSGFGSFIQTTHDSVPGIWTLSEPYGASDWWPCKQNLGDKIDSVDILITCPGQYKAASNGLLTETTSSHGNTTYHWRHRYPIATYLVCMAVTNYQVFSNQAVFNNDTLNIVNYVYPESFAADTPQAWLTVAAMQLYDSLVGLYPFSKEKYGQVQFGWGGGMEHQTMTFMHDYGFELVVHELAHHWFGDKVTCDSWQDIWLNEGFAVFFTAVSYQHIAPYWYPSFLQECINSAAQQPHGSVWCDDTTSVSRIFNVQLTYRKAGMVLHQLNWMLGDSVFYTGLRGYLTDTGNAYGFGNVASLQHHLEAACGHNLGSYFSQYVYGRGVPSFQIQWSQDFSKHISLTINQTPTDSSVSFFNIPVPVLFRGNGTDTLMVFNPAANSQTYTFDLPFLADTLVFDPNYDILSASNAITRQATASLVCKIYPNPVGTIMRAQVQAERGGNADLKVYNMQGSMVCSLTTLLQPGANFINLNTGLLAAGVYELRLVQGNYNTTAPFVISRH